MNINDQILFNGYKKTFEDKRQELKLMEMDELIFTEMTYENILKAKPNNKEPEPWQQEFINYIENELKRLNYDKN